MLADFQQALADMVASPHLSREVRAHPTTLADRYRLTDLEFRRLVDMVNQRGMVCNCILYRANRLAPLALNLRDLCKTLGDHLTSLVDEFWALYPEASGNFLVESERFCAFLLAKHERGFPLSDEALEAFWREHLDLRLRMLATRTVL
jgi:hypothetical protein